MMSQAFEQNHTSTTLVLEDPVGNWGFFVLNTPHFKHKTYEKMAPPYGNAVYTAKNDQNRGSLSTILYEPLISLEAYLVIDEVAPTVLELVHSRAFTGFLKGITPKNEVKWSGRMSIRNDLSRKYKYDKK